MLRILLLADINSAHTIRWASSLAEAGLRVAVFSFHHQLHPWHSRIANLQVFNTFFVDAGVAADHTRKKTSYLRARPHLTHAIREFNPDIVHAHYASSYGLLGALSGFRPFFISCWGSDVLQFPYSGFFQKRILKFNLRRASGIFVTSRLLQAEVYKLARKESMIIPFGVDAGLFTPKPHPGQGLVIGTVKSLEPVYRIDWIIRAFAIVQEENAGENMRLVIVGGGSLEKELKSLARSLCKNNSYEFTGKLAFEDIASWHNRLDIFVHASRNESFGVSILEASACGKPVIACASGGSTEVIREELTALTFSENDFEKLVENLRRLVRDEQLRARLGEAGRNFVLRHFDWKKNVADMISAYHKVLRLGN